MQTTRPSTSGPARPARVMESPRTPAGPEDGCPEQGGIRPAHGHDMPIAAVAAGKTTALPAKSGVRKRPRFKRSGSAGRPDRPASITHRKPK